MHISKIEIENIKSYAAATLYFARGTTAITGENGAGKTTIIEVIAWTLFDLLDYKKDEFLRRGAKKGWARLTFESGLDEREYEVYRDTGASYYVTDPRLKVRIADKREEVTRFLWQHLGLEPGTDLRSLFRHAIGVPQGTFTSIFLEGAAERKTAFDRLLKVEEYRQAADKLLETARFLERSLSDLREQIARAEGELAGSEEVEKERASLVEQISQLNAETENLKKGLENDKKFVEAFDLKERAYASAAWAFQQLRSELEKKDLVLRQLEKDLAAAVEAAERVKAVGGQATRHGEVLELLKALEPERDERDRLRLDQTRNEGELVRLKSDLDRLTNELAALQKMRSECVLLEPNVAAQEVLEANLGDFRERVAEARTLSTRITDIDERLGKLRESFKKNKALLDEASSKSNAAADIKSLEERDSQIRTDLAALRASMERDEKFQREIRNGLCPILSQRCLNLAEGETLEGFVTSQFEDLRSKIAAADGEFEVITLSLATARQAEKHVTALETYRLREEELTLDGKQLNSEKASLESRAAQLADAEGSLAEIEAKLAELADPRTKIRFLQSQLEREPNIRSEMAAIEKDLERLGNESNILAEKLKKHAELDRSFADLSRERDATADAHREFLAREAESKTVDARRTAIENAKAEHSEIKMKTAAAETSAMETAAAYDAERHAAARSSVTESEKELARRNTMIEAAKQNSMKLETKLARFTEIRASLAKEFREKERLEGIYEATAFIRATLKDAAPRVARNYVFHISFEANIMFREITGNAERTLKWGEDYAISLEEDGYERPFQSLSGGEQMAAALSVRLALLKQLTDIRIAFFDEPTTNMDAERRENLAQQISRITHFDQLFVISHDDTFEGYVDNVISIGEQA